MALGLHISEDGSYTLRSEQLNLEATIAAPSLVAETFGELKFGAPRESEASVAGVDGRIRADVAEHRGLQFTREFFQSRDGGMIGVRLTLKNLRDEAVRLQSLVPMQVTNPAAATIAGGRMADWRILRGSRQKNDIPGCFVPSATNPDWSDATFGSSDIPAGQGVAAGEGREPAKTVVESDPCVSIHNRNDLDVPGLFLTVFGQTQHLSTIRLARSNDAGTLEELSVTCEIDGASVLPGGERRTHWLLLRESRDAWEDVNLLAEWLARDAGVVLPGNSPTIFCTWYFYGEEFTQEDLEETLNALKHKRLPFDTFVIDNGWMTDFGTWQTNERFPDGMAHAAKLIADAGYRPGIWTCPFVLMDRSPMITQQPELIARDADGKPCPFLYRPEPATTFDPTSPAAPAYFEEMYGRLVSWGYTYHKMDFLRAVINAKNVRFQDPTATRAEAYRRGMQAIRDAVGPDAYLNACGGIYEAGLGLVDGQRSGSDTVGLWEGPIDHPVRAKPVLVAKQCVFRSYMNRMWHTDPDAVMLRLRDDAFRGNERESHLAKGQLTQEQAFTVIANQYTSGGAVCIAERMAQLQEDRRALLRHVIPPITGAALPIDLWHDDCPTLYLTDVSCDEDAIGNYWTLTISNWDDRLVKREIKLSEIGLPASADQLAVFELRTQRFYGVLGLDATLKIDVPPFATRVVRLAPWRQEPIVLGTDLHLTGGATELCNVRITSEAIEAELNTEWDFPVTVSGLFPTSEGPRVVRCFVNLAQPHVRMTTPAPTAGVRQR